jgi:hypothetical protein
MNSALGAWRRAPVTIRVAIVSAVVVIVAAFIGILPQYCPTRRSADVQLVEARIVDTDKFPKVDIKLRNSGTGVAFLKGANIRVNRVWRFEPVAAPAEVPVSWNYDVLLAPVDSPYMKTVPISQSIEPDGVDRFTITLGVDAKPTMDVFVYQVAIELRYNEDERIVRTGDLLYAATTASETAAMTGVPLDMARRIWTRNRQLAEEIKSADGAKSARLESFLHQVTSTPLPDTASNGS